MKLKFQIISDLLSSTLSGILVSGEHPEVGIEIIKALFCNDWARTQSKKVVG